MVQLFFLSYRSNKQGKTMNVNFYVNPGDSIQKAIDAAFKQNGGKVVLLPGNHPSKTIYLKSDIELHIPTGAVLEGGKTQDDYDVLPDEIYAECHTDACNRAFIAAADQENISITGSGKVEGFGPSFYNTTVDEWDRFYTKPTDVERPRMLHFANCNNIKIDGVHFNDAPRWTLWFIECDDVMIKGIRITGDPKMINNDGIHFFGGQRIVVSDCFVSTGDDSLVLRSGHAWYEMKHRVILSDVLITNCVFESNCQAIRVGCPGDDLIENCRLSNLIIKGWNGIFFGNSFNYWQSELATPMRETPHLVRNLSFDNITVDVESFPLYVQIDEGVEIDTIENITFSNFNLNGKQPLTFNGWAKAPLGTIRLENVAGTIKNPTPIQCKYVKELIMNNVNIQSEF